MRDDHAVNAAGWRGSRSVQIGVAIEAQEIDVVVVAAGAGEQGDGLGAVSDEDQDQGPTLDRSFGAKLEVVEAGDDFAEIAGAAMLFIVGEKARRAIALVDDFVAQSLQPLDKSRGAQSGGSFLASGKESGGARKCAN